MTSAEVLSAAKDKLYMSGQGNAANSFKDTLSSLLQKKKKQL